MIKAIETVYNGYRFRSRLEARWAVFFDAIGIRYEYEPEGFQTDDGTKYLPDFYLPELETYVEVKPENAFEIKMIDDGVEFPKDFSKYAYAGKAITQDMGKMFLIVFGDPYHAFPRPENGKEEMKSHLFYVGECATHLIMRIANKQNGGKKFYCTSQDGKEKDCSKCEYWNNIMTHSFPVFIAEDTFLVSTSGVIREHIIPFDLAIDSSKIMQKWKPFLDAALKARQARFEHGETPTINRRNY